MFAKNIKKKEIMNPNNKLPPSPKNVFGSLKIEKLKHKKIHKGNNNIIKNNLIFSSISKKYNKNNTEIVVKLHVPSAPSK